MSAGTPASLLDNRLRATRGSTIAQEFFTNSAHFPLANILLELLVHPNLDELLDPDLYFILPGALLQAWVLGSRKFSGKPIPMVGNLIGVAVYTVVELGFTGLSFFANPNHLAYWGFSLALGALQSFRVGYPTGHLHSVLMVTENVLRTSILLAMYWIFEGLTEDKYISLSGFLSDSSHRFIALAIPLLGVAVGVANLNAANHLALLQNLAARLRTYSEWLLGRELLERVVDDGQAFSLRRQVRTVMFMDIRGFTGWSESRDPEAVVAMVNGFYELAEPVWLANQAIKVKLTGDEVMAVFSDVAVAAQAAVAMRVAVGEFLKQRRLAAGIGLHSGPLIEGLLGSTGARNFDVLGDTVNTAKRICDQAAGGEVLISSTTREQLGEHMPLGSPRFVTVKGKAEPLELIPLLATTGA